MNPVAPQFGRLRLASPRDVWRIGIVAAVGFRCSPVVDWERPYHEKFPKDTLLSYRQEFSLVIKSPDHIVLVAVDKYGTTENSKTKAIIPPENGCENGWNHPEAGEEVVVGVGCWKLQAGSPRKGTFQNDTAPYPDLPENRDRDKHLGHYDLSGHRTEVAENKYFQGWSTMERLVVHPAYWKRGHGTQLAQWGLDLAKVDSIKQGVISAEMGKDLYLTMGFTNLEDLHIDGDEVVPQGVTVSAMEFDPGQQELIASEL